MANFGRLASPSSCKGDHHSHPFNVFGVFIPLTCKLKSFEGLSTVVLYNLEIAANNRDREVMSCVACS